MLIDGRAIASEINTALKQKVSELIQNGITPKLAVILVGNDPNSLVYVRQKKKVGEEIGVIVSVISHLSLADRNELVKLVKSLNTSPKIHGIIIQRPVPLDIPKEELDNIVRLDKDVDGFHPRSKFDPPVALAVWKILKWIYQNATMLQFHNVTMNGAIGDKSKLENCLPAGEAGKIGKLENFLFWLRQKKILVIGRGETAGKPIAKYLEKYKISFSIAHSKTGDLKQISKNADIVISCVGKPNIVRQDMLKPSAILIGVGLHPENDKLRSDYIEKEIRDKVAFYTPVPGGVGPVNVACLMENLVKAAEKST